MDGVPGASPRVVTTRMPPDIAACPLGVEVTAPLVWSNLQNRSGARLALDLAFSPRDLSHWTSPVISLPGVALEKLNETVRGLKSHYVEEEQAGFATRFCLFTPGSCVSQCSSILAGGCDDGGWSGSIRPSRWTLQERWTVTEWGFSLAWGPLIIVVGFMPCREVAKSWKMGLDDRGGSNWHFMGLFPFFSETLSPPFIGLLGGYLAGGALLFGEHLFIFPSTKNFREVFKNTGFDRLFLPQPFLTHLVSLLWTEHLLCSRHWKCSHEWSRWGACAHAAYT